MLPKAAIIIVPKPRFCHCSKLSCTWLMAQLAVVGWLIAGSCTWPCPQNPDWLCPCCEINCDTSLNALEASCGLQWYSSPFLLFFQIKPLVWSHYHWTLKLTSEWIFFSNKTNRTNLLYLKWFVLSSRTRNQSSKYFWFTIRRKILYNLENVPWIKVAFDFDPKSKSRKILNKTFCRCFNPNQS